MGEPDISLAMRFVVFENEAYPLHVGADIRHKGVSQGDNAIFRAFAAANGDAAHGKVEVFDAQPQALHNSQTGTVHKRSHKPVSPLQGLQEACDLASGENGRQRFWFFGANDRAKLERTVQDFFIEKEKRG